MCKLFSQRHSVLWTIRRYSTAVCNKGWRRGLSSLLHVTLQESHLHFCQGRFSVSVCTSAYSFFRARFLWGRMKFSVNIPSSNESNPLGSAFEGTLHLSRFLFLLAIMNSTNRTGCFAMMEILVLHLMKTGDSMWYTFMFLIVLVSVASASCLAGLL